MSETRKYELKRRAERQAETRGRIVAAAVDRLTVYRHFSTEEALLIACRTRYLSDNPLPDPEAWRGIADPLARLEATLADVYAYHRRTEAMMGNVFRDVPLKPLLVPAAAPILERWREMGDVLAAGWQPRMERSLLRAGLALALDFQTWRGLTRQMGLSQEQAIDLVVRMLRCL